jgi:hypothetical protein
MRIREFIDMWRTLPKFVKAARMHDEGEARAAFAEIRNEFRMKWNIRA